VSGHDDSEVLQHEGATGSEEGLTTIDNGSRRGGVWATERGAPVAEAGDSRNRGGRESGGSG
jgi:hypothetical protein